MTNPHIDNSQETTQKILDREAFSDGGFEDRSDPLTLEPFKVGDRVRLCKNCGAAFLEDSWTSVGALCGCFKNIDTIVLRRTANLTDSKSKFQSIGWALAVLFGLFLITWFFEYSKKPTLPKITANQSELDSDILPPAAKPSLEHVAPVAPPPIKKMQDRIPADEGFVVEGGVNGIPSAGSAESICVRASDLQDGVILTLSDGVANSAEKPGSKLVSLERYTSRNPQDAIKLKTFRGLFPLERIEKSSENERNMFRFSYDFSLSDFFPLNSEKVMRLSIMQSTPTDGSLKFRGSLNLGNKKTRMIGTCRYDVVHLTFEVSASNKNGDKYLYRFSNLYSVELSLPLELEWSLTKNDLNIDHDSFVVVGVEPL